MPVYLWEATTPRGESRAGSFTADNEAQVAQRLIAQGLVVGKIKKKPIEIELPRLGTGISLKDKVVFARTFSTMIDAGLPIVQSLDMLATQSESMPFRRVLAGIKAEVETGKSLSEAMNSYPKVFDELFRNLVAAGEAGGILDVIFRRLAVYLEKAAALRRQLLRALIYPSAIAVVGVLVVIVMMTRVLPVFARLFKDLGAGSLRTRKQRVVERVPADRVDGEGAVGAVRLEVQRSHHRVDHASAHRQCAGEHLLSQVNPAQRDQPALGQGQVDRTPPLGCADPRIGAALIHGDLDAAAGQEARQQTADQPGPYHRHVRSGSGHDHTSRRSASAVAARQQS